MGLTIICGVCAGVFCGVFLLGYFASKGSYDDYLEPLDKQEYGLKELFPMGIWIRSRLQPDRFLHPSLLQILRKREYRSRTKIQELNGVQYADFYFLIHQAYQTSMALLVAAAASFLAFLLAISDDSNAALFLAVSIAGLIGMPLLVNETLDSKIKKRRLRLQIEFPDFVNKLTVLVNAGLTISKAWEKIVTDNRKDSVLYREMAYTLAEIGAGKPEAIAYEEFGRRCKVKEIIKFVSIIVLNLKKGGAEVVPVLKAQGDECWEMRKNAAKRLGEEASTKILIPLMIMFIGILVIVATPALLSMRGI